MTYNVHFLRLKNTSFVPFEALVAIKIMKFVVNNENFRWLGGCKCMDNRISNALLIIMSLENLFSMLSQPTTIHLLFMRIRLKGQKGNPNVDNY